MKVFGTGLSGLVGSRIVEILSPKIEFEQFHLEKGADITNKQAIQDAIRSSESDVVFHFAAFTDVEGAELDREKGKVGVTWQVNVEGTRNIAEICYELKKLLVYISTDYVFDGEKKTYSEEDIPNPVSWYATTKYEGEKIVQSLGETGLIVRIANPYRSALVGKGDFVHKILAKLRAHETILAPTDQLFVPTYIDDIAFALKMLIDSHRFGIYHVVGSQALSPFTASNLIAETFNLPKSTIQPTTFESFFEGRAKRPFYAVLNNDRITKLGVLMSTFEEGLQKVKKESSDAR